MPNGKLVFKSFEELRRHFFPKQHKQEQRLAEIETILDESKFDQPRHKRRLLDLEDMGESND